MVCGDFLPLLTSNKAENEQLLESEHIGFVRVRWRNGASYRKTRLSLAIAAAATVLTHLASYFFTGLLGIYFI